MYNKAKELLKNYFGYQDFKPGQESIIKSVLKKKNTLGIMPTGSGKSICFQIPALIFEGLTIVISPLISLMKDQIDHLHKARYPAEMINSTVAFSRQQHIKELIQTNEIKLLYLTPERFSNEDFLNWIKTLNISLFVIDEAHCISEWGHDFRPEYRKLKNIIKETGNPPVLALTATATPEVKKDIIDSLSLKNCETIVTGFNRENLIYGLQHSLTKEEKNHAVIKFLKKVKLPGIIYTSSVRDADQLYLFLKTNLNFNFQVYHGSLSAEKRKKNQDDFLNDKTDILIATNAFGMGVNKKNIRFVLHYSLPGSIESYYQETGRAGRDGKESYCLLLYCNGDEKVHNFFIKSNNPPLKSITDTLNIIQKKSVNKILFTNELIDLCSNKEINSFMITTILKKLHFLDCIEFEYKNQEKIEIYILQNRIPETDKMFIEEIFNASIDKTRFYTNSIEKIAKRSGINKKELKQKLNELQNKKIIKFNLVNKGQVVKYKNNLTIKDKKSYEETRKRKIDIDTKKLNVMVNYTGIESCRKNYMLNYFGDKLDKDNCGKCDICRGTYQGRSQVKLNNIQREIIYFFAQHNGKIGKTKAVKILKGSPDIEEKFRYWDEYGILKQYHINDIDGEIILLLNSKLLYKSEGKYSVINLDKSELKKINA